MNKKQDFDFTWKQKENEWVNKFWGASAENGERRNVLKEATKDLEKTWLDINFPNKEKYNNGIATLKNTIEELHKIVPENDFDLNFKDEFIKFNFDDNRPFSADPEFAYHTGLGENDRDEINIFPNRMIAGMRMVNEKAELSNKEKINGLGIILYAHEYGHKISTIRDELIEKREQNQPVFRNNEDDNYHYYDVLNEIDAWKNGREVIDIYLNDQKEKNPEVNKSFIKEDYEKYNKWQTMLRVQKIKDMDMKVELTKMVSQTYQSEMKKEQKVKKNNNITAEF